jgi:mannosylglycerate hydrolase MGH1-like protein
VHWRPGYFELVARARRRDWDSRTIIAAGDAHLEDVLVNVAHALSLRALARLMAGAGRSGDAQRLEARAGRTESALLARCWDERSGLFFDLAGRRERPVRVSTWSSLSPLALGPAIPEDIRRRLVEEHLLHARRYGAEFGIPSVAIEEPAFRSGFDRWRTWRGASWMNSAWLLVPPLLDLGYRDEARRLAGARGARARLLRVLRRPHGPRARSPRLRVVDARRRSRRPRVSACRGRGGRRVKRGPYPPAALAARIAALCARLPAW